MFHPTSIKTLPLNHKITTFIFTFVTKPFLLPNISLNSFTINIYSSFLCFVNQCVMPILKKLNHWYLALNVLWLIYKGLVNLLNTNKKNKLVCNQQSLVLHWSSCRSTTIHLLPPVFMFVDTSAFDMTIHANTHNPSTLSITEFCKQYVSALNGRTWKLVLHLVFALCLVKCVPLGMYQSRIGPWSGSASRSSAAYIWKRSQAHKS